MAGRGAPWDATGEALVNMFDPDDLRGGLLDYMEGAADEHEEVAFYRRHGSFREQEDGVPEPVRRAADNRAPGQCYYNAQTAVIGVTDERVVYAEGLRASRSAPAPIPHAWLEHGGRAVEITVPAEMQSEAEYFGVRYDQRVVLDAMFARGHCSPLVEEPAEYPPVE